VEAELARRDETDVRARRLLDEAVQLDPNAFTPRRIRAEWRLEDENPAAALEDADMALAARPDDPRPRFTRLKALLALERATEAQADAALRLATCVQRAVRVLRRRAASRDRGRPRFDSIPGRR
jgi:hypothetical protein